MKPLRSTLLLLCALVATPLGAASTPALLEFQGHVVWLDFWASWCGPCKQSFPWMQTIQARYRDRGLIVVAVNLDHERLEADRFLSSFPHDFLVRFDGAGRLPSQMKVTVMPTSFLLDGKGTVISSHQGFRVWDEAQYEAEIERALGK